MKASLKVIAGLAVVLVSSFPTLSSAQDSGQDGASRLPPVQSQGQTEFITGGVGKDESDAIQQVAKSWPLTLELAEASPSRPQYISDVQIRIKNKSGNIVLDANAEGPFVLVKLPPGKYGIDATYESRTIHRDVTIQDGQNRKLTLMWGLPR
jgi:hypothetical protein